MQKFVLDLLFKFQTAAIFVKNKIKSKSNEKIEELIFLNCNVSIELWAIKVLILFKQLSCTQQKIVNRNIFKKWFRESFKLLDRENRKFSQIFFNTLQTYKVKRNFFIFFQFVVFYI